jgi:hypothetical protein
MDTKRSGAIFYRGKTMFKLQNKPTFWATAQISVPGESKPAKLEIEFKWLGREGIKQFFEGLDGRKDDDALGEIVLNWRGVDAEYTRENFSALLDNYPQAAMAIFEAFRTEALEAKAKN